MYMPVAQTQPYNKWKSIKQKKWLKFKNQTKQNKSIIACANWQSDFQILLFLSSSAKINSQWSKLKIYCFLYFFT